MTDRTLFPIMEQPVHGIVKERMITKREKKKKEERKLNVNLLDRWSEPFRLTTTSTAISRYSSELRVFEIPLLLDCI